MSAAPAADDGAHDDERVRSASETGPRGGLGEGGERADQRGAEQDGHERRGEAVARCRSEAQARPVMTRTSTSSSRWAIWPATASAVGPVHPARDPAVDEEDHAVGVRRRDRVVGDHHDRLAAGRRRSRAAGRAPRGAVRGVERAGRLVGEHDGRVGDQGAGDGDPLLLAAGQLRPAGGRARSAEADAVRAASRTRAAVRPAAGQAQRQRRRSARRSGGHQVEAPGRRSRSARGAAGCGRPRPSR